MVRIAIFHPTDPLGHIPSGIDSFVKGILKWAPVDLEYTLFGASSDTKQRPIGEPISVSQFDGHSIQFLPIVSADASSVRHWIPLSVRYVRELRRYKKMGVLDQFDILDFHRIEPALLFLGDRRSKNVVIHADSSVLRNKSSDIMWRHWPWLYDRLESKVFQGVDRVFAVRRSAVDFYSKRYPTISSRFSFIPTWMDSTVFCPPASDAERRQLRADLCRSIGAPEERRFLVFVGRLDHQKDPLLLIRSFAEATRDFSDLHLLIVGDGVLRSVIEAAVESNGLREQVTLLGVKTSTEIAKVLKSADIFVLSSAYEGMSIAVLEALAAGLPVVSTNVGEIDLVVRRGVNGEICDERTPGAFARSILNVVTRLDKIRGAPCVDAVSPYRPERVLTQIYENHRRQAGLL